MKKFNDIIANIEKELAELKEINNALMNENISLKKQQNMPIQNDDEDLSIEEVFSRFYLKDNSGGQKRRAFNNLHFTGVKYVSDFKKLNAHSLLEVKRCGAVSLAIIIIVLEHYGVNIDLNDTVVFDSKCKDRQLKQVKKVLSKYSQEIVFTD